METGEIRLQAKLTSPHVLTYMYALVHWSRKCKYVHDILTVSNNEDQNTQRKNSLVTNKATYCFLSNESKFKSILPLNTHRKSRSHINLVFAIQYLNNSSTTAIFMS